MTLSVALIVAAAAMIGCGIYLVLERNLTRVLVGVVMLGNGVNVLFLVASGPAGRAPIVGETSVASMSDPLPEALVLTAIVISLATAAFVLAMAHRNWQLNGHDDVQDDIEDDTIRRLALRDVTSEAYSATTSDYPGDDSSGDPGQGPDDDPLVADAAETEGRSR
jgi:multicomponent Na+:H+ antiporter subunit C